MAVRWAICAALYCVAIVLGLRLDCVFGNSRAVSSVRRIVRRDALKISGKNFANIIAFCALMFFDVMPCAEIVLLQDEKGV